jgi:hypothetical protein
MEKAASGADYEDNYSRNEMNENIRKSSVRTSFLDYNNVSPSDTESQPCECESQLRLNERSDSFCSVVGRHPIYYPEILVDKCLGNCSKNYNHNHHFSGFSKPKRRDTDTDRKAKWRRSIISMSMSRLFLLGCVSCIFLS